MATSQQILSLFSKDLSPGQFRGAVEGLKRFGFGTNNMGQPGGTVAQQRMVDDLAAIQPPTSPEVYVHPEHDQRAVLVGERGSRTGAPTHELSPTDLAWLSRLPTDPAQISYNDAVELAALARASSTFADRSSARLIQSVWAPVKEVHDAREAEVALRNAQRPMIQAPSTVLGGLAETVAQENPTLQFDEATMRANNMLREALDKRSAARDEQVALAREAVQRAADSAGRRTSLTKVA